MGRVSEVLHANQTRIITDYESGKSTCAIGKEIGVSNASVYLFLRDKCGVEIRKSKSLDDYKDDIIGLYNKGLSGYAIAKELKLNGSTCERYMQKLGLDTSNNTRSRPKNDMVKNHTKEIIELYEGGLGVTVLSKKFRCSETSIGRVLRNNGVETGQHQKNYYVNHHYFDLIDNEDKAYIVGFFTGDGTLNSSTKCFTIGITDLDILEEMKNRIGYDGPIYSRPGRELHHKMMYTLSICSKVIFDRFIEMGIPPNKTYCSQMPVGDNLPEDLFRHYLRGLTDADGSFYFNGHRLRWSLFGSPFLMEQIKDKIWKILGIKSFLYRNKKGKFVHFVRINQQSDLLKFGNWLYKDSTIHLARKKDKFDEFKRNFTKPSS